MRIKKNILWLISFTFICLITFAGNGFAASEKKESKLRQYRAVRPMGMGNAFAAIADDGDAFYYNPAGLTATKKFRLDLQPIRLIPTQDLFDELKNLDQLKKDIEAVSESDSLK